MKLNDFATEMRREVALKKISGNVVRTFHQGSAIYRLNRESGPGLDVISCTLVHQGGPYAGEWDEVLLTVLWPKFLKSEFEKAFPGELVEIESVRADTNSDKRAVLKTVVRLSFKTNEQLEEERLSERAEDRDQELKRDKLIDALVKTYDGMATCYGLGAPNLLGAGVAIGEHDAELVLATLPKLLVKLVKQIFGLGCQVQKTEIDARANAVHCVFKLVPLDK